MNTTPSDPFLGTTASDAAFGTESSDSLAGTGTTASGSLKTSLSEAGSHLKTAATVAGQTLKGAAGAAGSELKAGKAVIGAELSDTALAGKAAAASGSQAAKEQMDVLMLKGRDLVDSASALIRERPLAAFGVAFATGWIISKLGRSSSDT
jgi:ElaB/YqjD/DUF883 family membrane-anchored ribosome-binding protein